MALTRDDFPANAHDVEWAQVEVGRAEGQPAEAAAGCVFPSCATVHGGGANCWRCGHRTTVTCIRNVLPQGQTRTEFTDGILELGWSCPVCEWIRAFAIPLDDAVSNASDPAPDIPAQQNAAQQQQQPQNAPQQDMMVILMQMRDQMVALNGRMTALEEQRNLALPQGFHAEVVGTWKNVHVPQVKTLIRTEVSKVFKEYALPANLDVAREHEVEMRRNFDFLDTTLNALKPNPADNGGTMAVLHRVVVTMSASTHLGIYGRNIRLTYEKRANGYLPEAFTVQLQTRMLEQLVEAGKNKKKEYNRNNDRGTTGGYRGDTNQNDRKRDYDRTSDRRTENQGKGGRGGKN